MADLKALPASLQPKVSGDYIRAGCPFHGSRTQRSLSITKATGRFHCFRCGAWGFTEESRQNYLQQRPRRTTFAKPQKPLAAIRVADAPGSLDADALRTLRRWQDALPDAERYLASRCIPLDLAQRHGLGFCREGESFEGRVRGPRIVVPHTDIDGRVVSLYSRSCAAAGTEAGPPHYHLRGRAKGIFNGAALRRQEGPLFICEGVFDALSLLALGHRAVAVFGLSGWRWEWCRDREVILAFDTDQAADQAVEGFARQAQMMGVRVQRVTPAELGGCKDVNEAHTSGVLRIDVPVAAGRKPAAPQGLVIVETPPPGFPLGTWLTFAKLCAMHHPGAETWSQVDLYSLPWNPRHPLGAGALWLAAGFENLPLEFSASSLRLGHLTMRRDGLQPSGILPERRSP